ncbi:MAG TPA: phosphate ABC transporter substrate-binding protein PstS [Stellaceae bacterium]|nr:phosphate ABC transporter substrate-binding protein PstS [Stellaceae bacterium]
MKFRIRPMLAAAAMAALGALNLGAAQAMDISGAGSTFVYPVLAKWAADYAVKTGNHVNYQSIGSGGGIAQIKAATVDFGATDKPLDPDMLAKLGLGQFPLVIGGIVPVVNLDGIAPGQLKLSGQALADIYLGKIRSWNDPAIAKLNPGVALPATKISVVHRSDGSGTTFNFANFLSKVSPEWKAKVGADTAISWPTGIGGKGNEGVAAYTKQIKGAIGYVEYAYVLQNKMTYALVQNAAGKFVKPDAQSFQEAAATADWVHAKDFYLIMTNAPGATAYPIAATVFMLMYKEPKDPARQKATLDFFAWALRSGQPQAEALDYVPLPAALVTQIAAYWSRPF